MKIINPLYPMTKQRLLSWCTILLAAWLFSSCGKCDGCDVIYEVQGAALKISDTSLKLAMGNMTTISAERIVTKREGDRNCRNKNEISCMEDGLEADLLRIYCTSDLALAQGAIPAGTNLLTQTALLDTNVDSENVPYILLQAGTGFVPGRYTFVLRGMTKEGKEVEDIGFVHWE